MPNCTPQQCEELSLLLEALRLEEQAINLELAALDQEKREVEGSIELVASTISYCECDQMAAKSGKRRELTTEEKARVKLLLRLFKSIRGAKPEVKAPEQKE